MARPSASREVRLQPIDYEKVSRQLGALAEINNHLKNVGLTHDAIVVLLVHRTKLARGTIEIVLRQIGELSLWALAKKPPP